MRRPLAGGSTCVPICGVSDGRIVPLSRPPEGLEDLAGLAAPGFGGRLVLVGATDSTNRLALSLAPQLLDGDAVVADSQSAGRGRLGRSWHSPSGGNLYLTFALRPASPLALLPALTVVAAVALAEAVTPLVGSAATIRWPNDLLIGGEKTAGILAQTTPEAGGRFVALGVGVNVVTPVGGFPEGLRTPATSLTAAAGREVRRAALLRGFLRAFSRIRGEFDRSGLEPIVAARPELFPFLGGPIIIDLDGTLLAGTAVALRPDGAVVVRTDDGRTVAATSGEVAAAGWTREAR